MYKIKGAVIAIIGLAALILIISLLMPSTVVINRTVNVYGDPKPVVNEVKSLPGWRNWYLPLVGEAVLEGKDTNGKDYLKWERNGKVYILEEVELYDAGIRVALRAPHEKVVFIDVIMEKVGSQHQLLWRAVHKIKWYPWEKFAGLFINDLAGEGYQNALENLIKYTERKSSATMEMKFFPSSPAITLYR